TCFGMEVLHILVESNNLLSNKAKKEFTKLSSEEYNEETHRKVKEWVMKWRVEKLRFITKFPNHEKFLVAARLIAENAGKEFAQYTFMSRLLRIDRKDFERELMRYQSKEGDDEVDWMDRGYFQRVIADEVHSLLD
ncbi:hypothetical protein PENTCL1PPCAC_4812, partial [Pristionchus entomophagus]